MANGGAFGNPLTTGIALNFEVDMTPYRQMMQDNLKFAQTQAAERKAKEKEFQDILKNITYDDSKILKRRRDGARVEYASLINDVINLNKNGDRGGVQNRIADFRSTMNNFIDEKANFNLYEKAAREGKSWTSAEYINAMNGLDEGETSDESILKLYPDEIDYDSKSGTFVSQAIAKADAQSWANKILQGRALKSTNLKPEFVPETGEYRFPLSKVEDSEAFYKEMGALWLGGGESNVETMRREMGLTSDNLDGAGAFENSTEYMRSIFQDKIGGDRYGRPLAPKTTKPTYGFGNENIGDVSFSGKPSSGVSTESSTPEQIKQGRLDYVTNELQGPYDVAKSKDPDDIEDAFGGEGGLADVVESYGLTWDVPNSPFKQEVEITAGGVAHLLDPTKPDFVQKVANLVISGGNEEKIKVIASTPETTPEEFLTPESDSFFANIAGGKKPTTDWQIPAGTTVILTGDAGAVEVKLKNDMTFEDGKFQKAAKYKGKSGGTDTYYDIMFPIAKRDKDSYFTNLFNDANVLTEFKEKSPDQLPTSMYIKEDNGLFKSLLSVLQNKTNIGKMTEGSLQKSMDEIMKPMSTSGTASSGGAARRTEINESEIAAAAAASGRSEAEYRQLLQDNGIKIVP
jgi:hypothetical protein